MPALLRILLLAAAALPALAMAQAEPSAPATMEAPVGIPAGSLGGYIVVTPDTDWRAQWNSAIDSRPVFRTADSVTQGGVLHVLTFVNNPAPGLGNRARVRCDVQVVRPDGSASVNQRDVSCYEGILNGDPERAYLAAPTLTFRAEPTDQRGRWTVRMTLHDRNSGATLPLEASFTVVD